MIGGLNVNVLINFADDAFRAQQRLNSRTGRRTGKFDQVVSYSPGDIAPDFYEKNRAILSQSRGHGYWLWKPYFIQRTLAQVSEGDYVFYCDAGSYFIKPITPLLELSAAHGHDLMAFELRHLERAWTKRDAFILMDCDTPRYADTLQRMAGFSLWQKSAFTMNFIREYLSFAQDERIITDMENQCGHLNHPEFKEHRHDQSIFSLLTKRYEVAAYRDPTQWGNELRALYPNSPYDQLLEHTRRKHVPFLQKLIAALR